MFRIKTVDGAAARDSSGLPAPKQAILARHFKAFEGKDDERHRGARIVKQALTGTAMVMTPWMAQAWHNTVVYSAYFAFGDKTVENMIRSNFGESFREYMTDFSRLHVGSSDDVLVFGWPILTAAIVGGFALKLVRGWREFEGKLLEKAHKLRTEITVLALTAAGVSSEIWPVFHKGGFVTGLVHRFYSALSQVLPLDAITTHFKFNVPDCLDIPFVILGGIAAYIIFKPAQYFLDSIAPAKDKLRS